MIHHSFYNVHVSYNLFSTSLLDLEENDKLDWSFQRALCWVMGFLEFWSTFCGWLQSNLHVFIFCMGMTILCIFTLLLHIYFEGFPTALSSLCIQRSQKCVVSAGWCLQCRVGNLFAVIQSMVYVWRFFMAACKNCAPKRLLSVGWVFNHS